MTTITLQLPDELATWLKSSQARLPELLSQATTILPVGQETAALHLSSTYPVFEEMLDFLASSPTPQQIIKHKVSPAVQQRLEELLDKNGEGELTEEETVELDAFRRVNHLMILLKARAQRAAQVSPQ